MDNFEKQNLTIEPEPEETPQEKLAKFRNEVEGLAKEEAERARLAEEMKEKGLKGPSVTVHFLGYEFDSSELGPREMEVLDRMKKGDIRGYEFKEMQNQAMAEFNALPPELKTKKKEDSLMAFWGYAANKLSVIEMRRHIDEQKGN